MAGLFVILAFAAFMCALWFDREVYNALIDTFPPELKDDLTAKYALHGMALRRSTPLPIQRQYLNSLVAGVLFCLCLSLTLFSAGEAVGGWALLAISLLGAGSVLKDWRTYRKNCDWQATRDDGETAQYE